MLELESLVLALHLAQLFELRRYRFVHLDALGHDQAFACKPAPTGQHEGMDVKRGGDITDRNAGKSTQADGSRFELFAVAMDGSGDRSWHGRQIGRAHV